VRIPVEGDAGASSVAVLDAAARALVFGAALFSSFCYAGDITYGYDALGRLMSVQVADSAAYYDYDAAGNITAIRRQGASSAAAPVNRAGSLLVLDIGDLPVSTASSQASAR
jgi:YD repeat-containing protein